MTDTIEKAPILSDCVRIPTFAERWDVSTLTAYGWIDAGMPSFRIGKNHYVHVPTGDKWLTDRLTGEVVDKRSFTAELKAKQRRRAELP